MGSFLKKHRELLVIAFLLCFSLVTYASHSANTTVPGPIRRTIVWITSPVERAMVWSVASAQDAWYGYVALRDVREKNKSLQAEVLHLRVAQEKLAEIQAENERLKKMVAFGESAPEMRLLAAPVIAFGPDPKLRSIRIGRGSNDGLRAGQPVITPDGVVGRLTQVYDTAADVLLIIDPTSSVAALTQRTRTRATARGTGDVTRLRLDFIVKSDALEEHDILLTAPSGGLFPKGLPLGRATHVKDNPSAHGLFKSAELEPFVDFDRLEEVQVVVDSTPSAALDVPVTAYVR